MDEPRSPRSFGPGTVSRDAFASLAYAAAVRLATVGLFIAVARLSGAASAGALGVALQLVALVSLLATLNLPQSLTQRLSGTADRNARARLLRASGFMVAGLAILAGAAIAIGAPLVARLVYGDPTLTPLLSTCGALIAAGSLYLWVEGALQGLRRFGALARWGIVVAIADLVFGIVAAAWGVAAIVLVRAAVRTLGVLFAATRWLGTGRDSEASPSGPRASAEPALPSDLVAAGSSLFGFAAPALVAGVIVLLGQTLLRALLVRSAGLESAGHFQAAESLAQGLLLIPIAASTAFMPAVSGAAGRGPAALAIPFKRAVEQVSGYNLALSLAAIAVAPWVMQNVFGRDFGPARPTFVLLACAYALGGPSTIFGAWLMGRRRIWTIVGVNVAWAVLMLAAFRLGGTGWGAAGAAGACALAYLVALWIYALVIAPRGGLPVASHLPACAVTTLALAIGAALSLAPAVPDWLAAAGCLTLAALVFMRWGWPSLAGSAMWPLRRAASAAE